VGALPRTVAVAFLVISAALLGVPALARAQESHGTPAPDFPILAYPDDRKGSLLDLRGQVVLLNFWFPT
jgi:hypothetical protein